MFYRPNLISQAYHLTNGSVRKPKNALEILKSCQLFEQGFNDIVSLNIMPNHVAILMILAIGSNYCCATNFDFQEISLVMVLTLRGIMVILSLSAGSYLLVTFTMIGRVVRYMRSVNRSWRVAKLTRVEKKMRMLFDQLKLKLDLTLMPAR